MAMLMKSGIIGQNFNKDVLDLHAPLKRKQMRYHARVFVLIVSLNNSINIQQSPLGNCIVNNGIKFDLLNEKKQRSFVIKLLIISRTLVNFGRRCDPSCPTEENRSQSEILNLTVLML